MHCIVLRGDLMNVQMKKGIVEVCVLGPVADEPSYGYKIISDLSEIIEISESTLYPILKRLEAQDLLKTYNRQYNGRTRKYYEITKKGKKRIEEFLDEWQEIEMVISFIKRRTR